MYLDLDSRRVLACRITDGVLVDLFIRVVWKRGSGVAIASVSR
jgi:hypothetical protein